MTVTAPTQPRTDAKAGYCGMCRRGSHALCASDTCTCTTAIHNGRPKFARVAPRSATPARPPASSSAASRASGTPAARSPEAKLTEPVWELVRADPPSPPPKPRKLTAVERARPFLELILEAATTDWQRVAIFPTTMGAAQVRARVSKAYSKAEWEWRSAKNPDTGQSALYVRWRGTPSGAPGGQL
jgi:hypothetical protein